MKFRFEYLIVFVVLYVVIIMSLGCSCVKVSPYYKDNLYSNQTKFEAFSALSPATYTSDVGNVLSVPATKVEGFEGLQSAPFSTEIPIDIFSQAQGNLSCPPVGYSNSLGPLCLDKTQMNLLLTRGGNSTGKDSEIGPQ